MYPKLEKLREEMFFGQGISKAEWMQGLVPHETRRLEDIFGISLGSSWTSNASQLNHTVRACHEVELKCTRHVVQVKVIAALWRAVYADLERGDGLSTSTSFVLGDLQVSESFVQAVCDMTHRLVSRR